MVALPSYLPPYDIPGYQTVLNPRNPSPQRRVLVDVSNMAPSALNPPPDWSGKYGGIYADSSWNVARNWSFGRKDKIRGLQKATHARDLGQIDVAEGIFHRLFGERGTTTFEMETSEERQKLIELIGRVTRELPKLPPERAVAASTVLATASRLAATYPDTPADLNNWRVQYAQVTRDLKRYVPTDWAAIALGTAAVAVGLYAAYYVAQRYAR